MRAAQNHWVKKPLTRDVEAFLKKTAIAYRQNLVLFLK